jgi:basic membrane protein A and related proteins
MLRAVALLTGLLLLSACSTAVEGRPIAVPRPTKPKPPPAFLLLTGPGEDPVSQLAAKAAEKYVNDKKGKLTRVTLTSQASNDRTKVATAITQQKPTVVIAVRIVPDALLQVTQVNSGVQFLVVDGCAPGRGNVTCVEFRDYEGIYLLGVEAGVMTTTGKVGAVVAMDLPALKRFYVPFGQGAAAVKPGTTMTQLFLPTAGGSQFANPTAAEATAKQLGASHVMAVAFEGNKGVFKAAKEGGFSAFGMDVNECPNGLGAVADSMIRRSDIAVQEGLKAIDNKAGGKPMSVGIKENAITLASLEPTVDSSQCSVRGNQEALTKVKEIRDKIISGEVKVEDPGTR